MGDESAVVGASGKYPASGLLRLLLAASSANASLAGEFVRDAAAARRGICVRGRTRVLFARLDYAIAMAYGTLMFVLTPLVGTIPSRYALYAWPVFWIFGAAASYVIFADDSPRLEFILLSVVAAWTPAIVRLLTGPPLIYAESLYYLTEAGVIVSLAILLALYARGYVLLNRARAKSQAN
jgi:hypothetical protein